MKLFLGLELSSKEVCRIRELVRGGLEVWTGSFSTLFFKKNVVFKMHFKPF